MNTANSPLRREFIRYLIPSVAAQWVFALYTMVDGMFVARGVSELALASVNLSTPFVNLLFSLSLVIAVGSSTIISIHFGQKDPSAANRTYTQNMVIVLLVSLTLSATVLLNRTRIAVFLGADEETLPYVTSYIGAIACFAVFFMLSYYFEILIKADGKPKLATLIIITGAVANCILDYVFIFVIPWGVFGAAFATGLSQMISTIIFAAYFFSSRARLRLCKFRFSPRITWRTCKLGMPSGITELSSGLMIFLFNHAILNYIGTDAVVSYTIVAYVNTIIVMSMTGVAQGVQPLVSFYYGRGEHETNRQLLRYALASAIVLTLLIAVPTWLGADGIVSLFISADKPELRTYSTEVFRTFSTSFLLLGVNIIYSGYFTAVEYAKSAISISVARSVLFITASLWLLTTLFGGSGIWWAPALSEALCLILTMLLAQVYRHRSSATCAAVS